MVQANFLAVPTASGLMDVYVASPEGEGNFPVVLVYQEAFGVNHHIQSICERLAHEGYLAVAPDLFHRLGRRITVEYSERKGFMDLLSKISNEGILEDTRDVLNFLKDIPHADLERLSSVGFCIGGFSSALVATEFPIKKMISFYGGGMVRERPGIGLRPIVGEFRKIQGECLFFFGCKDASIPAEDVKEVEKALLESGIPFEVRIFEKADHGFFCDERKSYSAEEAKVAWEKTIRFLKEMR